MQEFCAPVNYTMKSERKIPQEIFLEVMASVMYRLVRMRFPANSPQEAVRLGLSAFCSNVFLQWSNVHFPHRHLPTIYKECLLELRRSNVASPRILFWILMVGAMAVFTKGDAWLEPWLSSYPASWGDARVIMKSFLWIDFIHDRCGAVIRSTVRRPHPIDIGDTPLRHALGLSLS